MLRINNSIPITEQSNFKSENIDIQNVKQIVEILYECETEIFGGYKNYRGILDKEIINKSLCISQKINNAIEKFGSTNIVLIGAGTSGRLCRLIAKLLMTEYNASKINIIPVIAGGITALIKSEPNTEDNFETGVHDYYKYTKDINKTNCFLFGISCGLSANYVNGALQANLANSNFYSVLVGFNPVSQATINFKRQNNLIVLNPIIGSEAITGSVRMKSGTATMILLRAIICSGMNKNNITSTFKRIVFTSKNTLKYVFESNDKISKLITLLGDCLNNNGQVHILGISNYGTLAIYDAAECPPTFGANIEQINGYTENGISELKYYDYEGNETLPKDISFNDFFLKIQKRKHLNDIILIITDNALPDSLLNKIDEYEFSNINFLVLNYTKYNVVKNYKTINFNLNLPDTFQRILFIRSLLINLSTGSFILNGKVFKNMMIDLQITNKKLFYRATRIISQITGFNDKKIIEILEKKIYNGSDVNMNSMTNCINIASFKSHIVPETILALFYPDKTNIEIEKMLKSQPIIRKLVETEIQNKESHDNRKFDINKTYSF